MTVNNIVHILFFFFVCLSIKNISLDIDDVKRIFKYFIFGALINSIYVGAKLFLFSGISIAQQNGFWRDPATFGVTLVITIMYFLISLSNKTLSRKIKSIYGIIIIYLIFILFASGSRTGFFILIILFSHYLIIVSKIKLLNKLVLLISYFHSLNYIF